MGHFTMASFFLKTSERLGRMGRKSRTTSSLPGRTKKAASSLPLQGGPTPAERLAQLEAVAAARGLKPMTEEEFERFIADHQDAWPNEAEVDEFVTWIHQCRREGRYR